VDDQEPLVALMVHVLSKLGYDVIGCTSSEKALGAFAAQPHNFDAVVSDVRMPAMSGFDLAQRILAIRPGIPILLTSGHILPEDEQTALNLGLPPLILKTETVQMLGQMLHRLLSTCV